jgi:hypothetical protein
MKSKILGVLALGLLVSSANSYAGYLSTGEPVIGSNGQPGIPVTDRSGTPIRGAQFTLASTTTITSAEHWAAIAGPDDPDRPDDGWVDVRMSIWGDSVCSNPVASNFPCPADNPISGQPLYSGVARVSNGGPAWIGLTGLSWVLDPGTYWLVRSAVEPRSGLIQSPFSGCFDGSQACGFFDGADHEASWQFGFNNFPNAPANWAPNGARTGWRLGVPSAVPEPGTLALLGLGLAGLCLSRRRKAH